MLLSSSQLLELIVVLCSAQGFFYAISRTRSALAHAQSISGPVRPDSVPALSSAPFTAVQVIVVFLVPTVYIFTVVGAGLQWPLWMYAFAFPEVIFGVRVEGFWKNTLRVLACVVNISLRRISDSVYEHLSDQYHPIGVRARSLFTLATYTNLIDIGWGISVARNQGSSRRVRTPGFVIPSTRTPMMPLLSFES